MKTLHLVLIFTLVRCSSRNTHVPVPPDNQGQINWWMTLPDKTALLQKQVALSFDSAAKDVPSIEVDSSQVFQSMDGFGYTLTGGSAMLMNKMARPARQQLLWELFSSDSNALAISCLRLGIGATDLSSYVYSYDDLPDGQTDPEMTKFSLAPERADLLPVLKEILAINPAIKILATPWSPPVWMKDNNSSIGGSLKKQFYPAYAKYFVRYIEEMKKEGISIFAVTPQNEPLHPGNNPSLLMTAEHQTDFIKNHLGPAFKSSGIDARIIIYDHNCDKPDYPLSILNDSSARSFVDGSAFHLYAGEIGAMSAVHESHPDKNIYFTEQYTSATGQFGGDLHWHLKNLVIGAPRNWSKTVLEWNLANDPAFGPHTPGGCTSCLGALTINGSEVQRNVAYYIIGHISKFVPPGSVRIKTNNSGSLLNVAFKTPAGKKVLIILNENTANAVFNITFKGRLAKVSMPAGAVGSFVW